MHLEIKGSGPIVLLLHGMPQRPGSCWQLGQHLTDDYTVVVPSLPGYGASPALESYDFAQVDAALVAELKQRDLADVHAIVGLSGGAYRALRLAVHGHLSPQFLGLFGALAGPMDDGHKALFHDFAAALRQGVSLRDAVLSMAEPSSLERLADLGPELESWLAACTPETLAQELEAFTAEDRLIEALPKLTQPALVMVGEGDVHAPVAESEAIAAALPHATLRVVPQTRHALWWEAEDACVDALRDLLGAAK